MTTVIATCLNLCDRLSMKFLAFLIFFLNSNVWATQIPSAVLVRSELARSCFPLLSENEHVLFDTTYIPRFQRLAGQDLSAFDLANHCFRVETNVLRSRPSFNLKALASCSRKWIRFLTFDDPENQTLTLQFYQKLGVAKRHLAASEPLQDAILLLYSDKKDDLAGYFNDLEYLPRDHRNQYLEKKVEPLFLDPSQTQSLLWLLSSWVYDSNFTPISQEEWKKLISKVQSLSWASLWWEKLGQDFEIDFGTGKRLQRLVSTLQSRNIPFFPKALGTDPVRKFYKFFANRTEFIPEIGSALAKDPSIWPDLTQEAVKGLQGLQVPAGQVGQCIIERPSSKEISDSLKKRNDYQALSSFLKLKEAFLDWFEKENHLIALLYEWKIRYSDKDPRWFLRDFQGGFPSREAAAHYYEILKDKGSSMFLLGDLIQDDPGLWKVSTELEADLQKLTGKPQNPNSAGPTSP